MSRSWAWACMIKCHQLRVSESLFRGSEDRRAVWLELKLNFSPFPYGEEQSSMCLKNMIESSKIKAEIILNQAWSQEGKQQFFFSSLELHKYTWMIGRSQRDIRVERCRNVSRIGRYHISQFKYEIKSLLQERPRSLLFSISDNKSCCHIHNVVSRAI